MNNDETRSSSKAGHGHFDEADVENDALWDLLGDAKPVEVSPFFSRNVLRQVRKQRSFPSSLFGRLPRLSWRFAPAAAAMVLLMGVTVSQVTNEHQSKASKPSTERKDIEVIKNLDTLLAAQESSLWLDDAEQ